MKNFFEKCLDATPTLLIFSGISVILTVTYYLIESGLSRDLLRAILYEHRIIVITEIIVAIALCPLALWAMLRGTNEISQIHKELTKRKLENLEK